MHLRYSHLGYSQNEQCEESTTRAVALIKLLIMSIKKELRKIITEVHS